MKARLRAAVAGSVSLLAVSPAMPSDVTTSVIDLSRAASIFTNSDLAGTGMRVQFPLTLTLQAKQPEAGTKDTVDGIWLSYQSTTNIIAIAACGTPGSFSLCPGLSKTSEFSQQVFGVVILPSFPVISQSSKSVGSAKNAIQLAYPYSTCG